MLAGCSSSTLLSPRHRLRSEASSAPQFQACHFQLPSMSTQRLDLPCSFNRKDTSRSQSIRPVGLSVEKPIESKTTSCSLKQNIRLPPLEGRRREAKEEFWAKGKGLKRFSEQGNVEDESCLNRAKRKKRGDEILEGNFWFQPGTGTGLTHPFSLTCSGEEEGQERVCFVPSDLISSPLPLINTPWVTEITDFGEKDVETTSHGQVKNGSDSSNSSESRLVLRLNEVSGEQEVGNGSRNPYPHQGSGINPGEPDNQREQECFELVSLLTACVEAIGSKNIALINHLINKLGDLASPKGSSPITRLIAYYTEALALRVTKIWPHVFHISTPREFNQVDDDDSLATGLRLLNQVTPIPKFIHFTSNEVFLRAFEGKDKVHIIDFEIKQGLQWPSLFQSLASRTNPPSHVRITGIGESKQELNETGERLSGFAESLNLPFEFHPVVDRLEDVRLWMLHVKENESVGVNCIFQLHKMLYDYDRNGKSLRDFLGLMRSTNPTVVVMAEQEAEHNDPRLEIRVSNSLKYYSAVFDSVDSSLPFNSPARIKIEEIFGKEIRNVVGCEGSDRVERHVGFEKWKKMMEEKGGFRCVGISEREIMQSQLLLKMYSNDSYNVKKIGGDGGEAAVAITLNWEDQPLYTVSAWTPADIVAGSSSSFSQS